MQSPTVTDYHLNRSFFDTWEPGHHHTFPREMCENTVYMANVMDAFVNEPPVQLVESYLKCSKTTGAAFKEAIGNAAGIAGMLTSIAMTVFGFSLACYHNAKAKSLGGEAVIDEEDAVDGDDGNGGKKSQVLVKRKKKLDVAEITQAKQDAAMLRLFEGLVDQMKEQKARHEEEVRELRAQLDRQSQMLGLGQSSISIPGQSAFSSAYSNIENLFGVGAGAIQKAVSSPSPKNAGAISPEDVQLQDKGEIEKQSSEQTELDLRLQALRRQIISNNSMSRSKKEVLAGETSANAAAALGTVAGAPGIKRADDSDLDDYLQPSFSTSKKLRPLSVEFGIDGRSMV
jgi:hypothetical protein